MIKKRLSKSQFATQLLKGEFQQFLEPTRQISPAGAERVEPRPPVKLNLPERDPVDQAGYDKLVTTQQAQDPWWKRAGRVAIETPANLVRGVVGDVDETSALTAKIGALMAAAIPPGKIGGGKKIKDAASEIERRMGGKLSAGLSERRMTEIAAGVKNPPVPPAKVPDELLTKFGGTQQPIVPLTGPRTPHPMYKGGGEPSPRPDGLGRGVQTQITSKKPLVSEPRIQTSDKFTSNKKETLWQELKREIGQDDRMTPKRLVQPQLKGIPTKVAKVKQETSKLPSLIESVKTAGLKVYETPAKSHKEALSRFPKEKDLIKLYQKGKGGEDFYTEFKPTIARYMGEENVDQFIDYLASTSPANQLRANVEMAVRAMEQAKSGKPFAGFMKAHSMNLDRAKAGQPLSGPKVQTFQKNLKTGVDATDAGVTVDRWMVGIYGGDPKGAPSKELYGAIQGHVQKLAKKLGVSPKDLQAGLWAGARGKKESISSIMQDSFGQRDLFNPEALSVKATARAQQLGVGNVVKDVTSLTEKNGGATYSLSKGNLAGTPHYSVAVFPEKTVKMKGAPNQKAIANYINKNRDVLDNPEYSLGTWHDKEKDEFVLDVVRTVPDRLEAIKLGQRYNQDAIFDLNKLEDIRLDETLDVSHFSPQEGLTELDPKFQGTGRPGAERQRMSDPEHTPNLWGYLDKKRVESPFKGMNEYEAKIAKSLAYDQVNDPLKLEEEAVRLAQGQRDRIATIFTTLVKKAGYKGWRDEYRVAWFDKLPVTAKKK